MILSESFSKRKDLLLKQLRCMEAKGDSHNSTGRKEKISESCTDKYTQWAADA